MYSSHRGAALLINILRCNRVRKVGKIDREPPAICKIFAYTNGGSRYAVLDFLGFDPCPLEEFRQEFGQQVIAS
jgi:hypothetical protein